MKIKVCGITRRTTQEQLSPDIDFKGYIFYSSSPRYIDDRSCISENTGVGNVAVFVNEKAEYIRSILKENKIDYVQLHGDESPEFCAELFHSGVKIIKAFRINESFSFPVLRHYEKYCRYFLFDAGGKYYGGNGKRFNWNLLKRYEGQTPFFISGGIKPEHLSEIIRWKSEFPLLAGVDINSGFEISPGEKNCQLINDFVKQIKLL